MENVGIRELRQNASAVIRRVEQLGRGIEVTVQGRPAAVLVPIDRRRPRTVRSEDLEAAVAELQPDATAWLDELHASREDDTDDDPWSRPADR